MGKMALGYGSEFHLLRYLGRHRTCLDLKVQKLLDIDNLTWLDFDFDPKADFFDSELKGLSFLTGDPSFDAVDICFKKEWPQSGNAMNWDAIAYSAKEDKKIWILVEAKAHIGEISQDCRASAEISLAKIETALEQTVKNIGVYPLPNNPWTKRYYQLANRLYVLDLLKRNGVDAILLNIYFTGDMYSSSRKSPIDKMGWQSAIQEMKNYLNIKDANALRVFDLFLDVVGK